MARRKKGNPVHGWLVLDKPPNMTSTQAVGAVRRAFDAQKAGHSGTLDPLATGILPIALGEATKTVSFAVDGEKAYRFTVRWGGETDTDDTEGVLHHACQPARSMGGHRNVIFLVSRGRDRIDAGGMRLLLVLRHQRRRGYLWDHEARIKAGFRGQKGG